MSQKKMYGSHNHNHSPAGGHLHGHIPAHSGPHHHGGHSHDFAEANKTYFNQEYAQMFDVRPDVVEAAQRIAQAMLQVYPFDEQSTTVMDYACGTGSSDFPSKLIPEIG